MSALFCWDEKAKLAGPDFLAYNVSNCKKKGEKTIDQVDDRCHGGR